MKSLFWIVGLLTGVHQSCTPVRESPKYQFADGVYSIRAIYLGRRQDVYHIRRRQTQLGLTKPYINHYGLSFGVFAGLGSTAMNPWVTNNQLATEYDGAVLPFGATALFALNNITFGVATGIDHLLDDNRKFWIYKGKPWLGLTIGLNLN